MPETKMGQFSEDSVPFSASEERGKLQWENVSQHFKEDPHPLHHALLQACKSVLRYCGWLHSTVLTLLLFLELFRGATRLPTSYNAQSFSVCEPAGLPELSTPSLANRIAAFSIEICSKTQKIVAEKETGLAGWRSVYQVGFGYTVWGLRKGYNIFCLG